jgi:hypothetical protein
MDKWSDQFNCHHMAGFQKVSILTPLSLSL